MTLAEYLVEWLKSATPTIRANTAKQYESIVRLHLIPLLGSIKLMDLRPDQVQAFYNAKQASGTSVRNVRMIHSVLHRALNRALQLGLLGRNPSQPVTKPRLRKKEMSTLTDVQVRTLLMVAKDWNNGALYHLAVTTGLRQGEILGLKWADLDWNEKKLHIRRQLQHVCGTGYVFTEPKSASGTRTVVLGLSTFTKLKEHYKIQQQKKLELKDQWKENDLIFPSSIGTPLDHRNLYREYKALLAEAGLPSIRFHDLRHTAASLMLQENIHPKILQEMLGHSDISLTLGTYSHILPGIQRDAANKLDDLLSLTDISEQLKPKNDSQVGRTDLQASH